MMSIKALTTGLAAVIAVIPTGDMLAVLNHGSPAIAYGVHAVTALVVAATGALLLRESAHRRQPIAH